MKKVYLDTLTPEEIIKRLKNGEIIKLIDSETKIKMIDGVLVRLYESGHFTIGDDIFVEKDDDHYFEEEEKFEITEIGLYKTRGGRKAYVSCVGNYQCFGLIDCDSIIRKWDKNGKFRELDTDYDLISKWED